MKIKAIIAGLLVVLYFADNCDGLMCYFCEDTSNESGKNQCQAWMRTLKFYRKKYNSEGQFKSEKYVKNCTGYADKPEEEIYCGIFETKSRGTTRSFIRDCSDGKNFFDDSLNVQFENRILGDNQTTCVYKGTSDIVCITLCTGKGNDFCNGPLLSSASQEGLTKMFLLWISMLSVCASLFK
ncbi:uncharacterized protein LOC128245429 [Mya arenaria]|uniref:uncharacterized protein LOC128245429 n=1 Tax=Mya arenaria TaxID=6604 RepID=UPI0022E41C2B|nr:uncharacterized protein LOC128245429 [Mya arenaria]